MNRPAFALLCAAACAPVLAQEIHGDETRPGMSSARRQANDFLMSIYRLPEVQDQCRKLGAAPKPLQKVVVPFDGPGHEFTVDCEARHTTLDLAVRFYRSYDVTMACEKDPDKWVSVFQLGYDVPVDCRQRRIDLELFEPWLRERQ